MPGTLWIEHISFGSLHGAYVLAYGSAINLSVSLMILLGKAILGYLPRGGLVVEICLSPTSWILADGSKRNLNLS